MTPNPILAQTVEYTYQIDCSVQQVRTIEQGSDKQGQSLFSENDLASKILGSVAMMRTESSRLEYCWKSGIKASSPLMWLWG